MIAGHKRTAAMVILRSGSQYLLLQRYKAPNAGMYVPVGGKLDPGEDPRTTAIRETAEETGILLSHVHYAGALVESSPTDYNWWCNIYVADIDWCPAPPCDEGSLRWVDHNMLLELPTPPTDWHIYQFVLENKPFALNAIYNENLQLIRMQEEISGQWLVGSEAG